MISISPSSRSMSSYCLSKNLSANTLISSSVVLIIIGVLIGFILGFSTGTLFYSKLLDKPEVVNQNKIKQKVKVKGTENNADLEYQDNQVIEIKNKKRRRRKNES